MELVQEYSIYWRSLSIGCQIDAIRTTNCSEVSLQTI
jgi:hypothetical protein